MELVVLGGGPVAECFIDVALNLNFKVSIFTCNRHSQSFSNIKAFEAKLAREISVLEDFTLDRFPSDVVHNGIFFSFGASWIFKQKDLDKLKYPILNCHGTPLPLYRGGGAFSWQIMAGNPFGALCFHEIDEGLDTGPILWFEEFIYPEYCIYPEHYIEHYLTRCYPFFNSVLHDLSCSGIPKGTKQQTHLSSYFPRLNTDSNGYLDWSLCGRDLERFIRAFGAPFGGVSTFVGSAELKVRILKARFVQNLGVYNSWQVGLVIRKTDQFLIVVCQDGCLVIEHLTSEVGQSLLSQIKLGDRFFTPSEWIERSLRRAVI